MRLAGLINIIKIINKCFVSSANALSYPKLVYRHCTHKSKRIMHLSPFMKRSLFVCLHLKLSDYSVSIFCCLGFSSSEGEGGYEVIEALKFWLVFQLIRIDLKKNR